MRLFIFLFSSTFFIPNAVALTNCPPPDTIASIIRAASGEISGRLINKEAIKEDINAKPVRMLKNIKTSSMIIRAKLGKIPWTVKETRYESSKLIKCVYFSSEDKLPVLEITGDLD